MTLTRRAVILGGMGAAAGAALAGCGADDAPGPSPSGSGASSSGSAASGATAEGGPVRLTLAQSIEQEEQTLTSLRRLDHHPMFAMHWYGDAAVVDPDSDQAGPAERPGYACTLFAALGDPDQPLVGRNFDWDHNPALVTTSKAGDGPATLTITDLSFLGIDQRNVDLLDDDEQTRRLLLRAQGGCVEGVNEHGLFIGLAADDLADPPRRGKVGISGLALHRVVLDRAATVEQALAVIDEFDVDFTGGPGLHYLLADRAGHASVAEFDQGGLVSFDKPADQPWHCMENFHFATTEPAERARERRYGGCAEALSAVDGAPGVDGAMELLDQVRQGITQWSAVYDLARGEVVVRTSASDRLRFSLADA